jgi:YVTN family beta-propeller protein
MRVPRWVLGVVAAALVVLAVDVAIVVIAHDAPETAAARPTLERDAVAVIDPSENDVVANVSVGRQPTGIAAGYGAAWVLNRGDGTLTHIDAKTRAVVSTMEPDATANDITLGAGGVWFVGRPRGVNGPLQTAELERIDPATGAVDRSFETSTGASVIAAGGDALWSTGYLGGHVRGAARSDAHSGAMRKIDIGIYGDLVTADQTAVYYVASIGNRVARVSTRTGTLTNSMTLASDESLAAGNVPPSPTDVVLGAGSLWISTTDGSVLKVDEHLGGIRNSIHACHNALAIAYGEGGVWVACGDNSVVRIDPVTDETDSPISVGGLPRGIAAGAGAVWVTINR